MMRIALVAIGTAVLLSACASPGGGAVAHYSVTPQVDVVVRGEKKRTTQANYQARPDEAPVTGSGGSR